jgi:hypothetical protein
VRFDARARKVLADLAEVRFEMLASVMAVALGSVAVAVWQPAIALVVVGVLPLAALVVALGAARIGHARAAEWSLLTAIGAEDGFATTLARVEGACFGASAAVVGLLVSSILALLAGGATLPGWDVVWLVVATAVASASASIAGSASLSREDCVPRDATSAQA